MHEVPLFLLAIQDPTDRLPLNCFLIGCVTVQLPTLTLLRYSVIVSISVLLLGCANGPSHVSRATPTTWPIHVVNPPALLVKHAQVTDFATFSTRVQPGSQLEVFL